MKKLFILFAIAGAFLMTSCKNGATDEAKMKLKTFDSTWTAMGTMAAGWGDSLKNACAMCEKCCADGDAMECCEHMKGTKDSLMMPCKNDMSMMQDMKNGWDAEMPKWDSLHAKLDGLKAKVEKGDSNDEEINKTLRELQTAMDEGGKGMQEWITKFSESKMACMKNMDACKMGWSNANCPDKKCSHHKEMKKS